MPFSKGKSGNPGGRPKALLDVLAAAQMHTATAIDTLAKICTDEKAPHSARVAASVALLDRGWGRPTQMLGSDPSNPLPSPVAVTYTINGVAPKP